MQQIAKREVVDGRSQSSGFPSTLLARVVRADAAITFDGMDEEGNVKFSAPMCAVSLNRRVWLRTPLLSTTFFVDLLGELLVRKNVGVFSQTLEELNPANYDATVNGRTHKHFGMTIDANDVMHFRFHISLAQQILTEDLEAVFRD